MVIPLTTQSLIRCALVRVMSSWGMASGNVYRRKNNLYTVSLHGLGVSNVHHNESGKSVITGEC